MRWLVAAVVLALYVIGAQTIYAVEAHAQTPPGPSWSVVWSHRWTGHRSSRVEAFGLHTRVTGRWQVVYSVRDLTPTDHRSCFIGWTLWNPGQTWMRQGVSPNGAHDAHGHSRTYTRLGPVDGAYGSEWRCAYRLAIRKAAQ